MAVICFSSLKGGVGKTTLSLSVASAFAQRGCETLLIDLDPAEHASRFLCPGPEKHAPVESPMAKLFIGTLADAGEEKQGSLIEEALCAGVPLVRQARPRFSVLPAGPELRHFLWGKGARTFKQLFPRLIEELNCSYDYVLIDTPPDYNVLTRNAIAAADLVVVPIDASIMSIHCLERLFVHASHIKGPTWSIIRTMVSRQASRVQKMSNERLSERLSLCSRKNWSEDDEEDFEDFSELDLEDADGLIAMFDGASHMLGAGAISGKNGTNGAKAANGGSRPMEQPLQPPSDDGRPIYLLNSVVYRTEDQNKLSFLGKTAFDLRSTSRLAEQYLSVARELEQIVSFLNEEDAVDMGDDFIPQAVEHMRSGSSDWESPKLRTSSSY